MGERRRRTAPRPLHRQRRDPAELGNLEPGDTFTTTFAVVGPTTYVDDRDRSNTAYHGAVTVVASDREPAPSDGGGSGTAPPSGAASPASAATITMADRAFSPTSVVTAPGGTITWRNADDRAHTGTAESGAFDTGNSGPGPRRRRPTRGRAPSRSSASSIRR